MRNNSLSGCLHVLLSARVQVMAAALVCCAIVALAGCGSLGMQRPTSTPLFTPTIATTSTPTMPPKVVFQADWSHGAGIWKLPPHWTIQDGALVTDGLTTDRLPVPYTVTTSNYRILFTSRMVDVLYKQTSCNNYFGVLSVNDSGAEQYEAQSVCFGPLPFHGDSRLTGANGDGKVWENTIGRNNRTSRVDVYGDLAAYFPTNTGSIGSIQNEQPNTPAHLFLEASQVKVVITSFVIMTM